MKPFLTLILLLCSTVYASAQSLNRPIIHDVPIKNITFWMQFDTFNEKFDILNYSSKFAPNAAKIDYYETNKLGFLISPLDKLSLSYEFGKNRSRAIRFTEPKDTRSQTFSHHARLQYSLFTHDNFSISAELGFIAHNSPTVNFYKYQFGQVNVSWPGHALVSLKGKDTSKTLALRAKGTFGNFTSHLGFERRFVDIDVKMTSESTTISNLLVGRAPQAAPWQEQHDLAQLSLGYNFFDAVSLEVDYQHIEIKRMGYIPRAGKIDYDTNDTLDIFIFWNATDMFIPYIHGHLSKRFTLGQIPLEYNQRSNHKFKYPFGYLSAGVTLKF